MMDQAAFDFSAGSASSSFGRSGLDIACHVRCLVLPRDVPWAGVVSCQRCSVVFLCLWSLTRRRCCPTLVFALCRHMQ